MKYSDIILDRVLADSFAAYWLTEDKYEKYLIVSARADRYEELGQDELARESRAWAAELLALYHLDLKRKGKAHEAIKRTDRATEGGPQPRP